MKLKSLHSESGQALVESIVAIGALMLGLMGVLTLLSRAIGTNRLVSDSYVGAYLASEGVEVVKNNLDHNVILNSQGIATPWNDGICNFPGGTSSFEPEYDTTDLASVRIGDASFSSTRVILYDPSRYYQYASGVPTQFLRTVRVDCNVDGGDGIAISSVVSWITRGGASFTTTVEDHFYHWR